MDNNLLQSSCWHVYLSQQVHLDAIASHNNYVSMMAQVRGCGLSQELPLGAASTQPFRRVLQVFLAYYGDDYPVLVLLWQAYCAYA